jgi:signal transduction histidine kinase
MIRRWQARRQARALSLLHLVALFVASMLVLIWGAVAYEIGQDRADARQEWLRNLENLTRAIEEHTVRTVTGVDEALKYVRAQYLRQGPALDLAGMVRRGEISARLYNQVGVIDAQGNYVLSSLPFKPMYLGDRAHFSVHRNAKDDALFVSKPVLGRASGRWSIQLTRAVRGEQGQFGGVVVASLDPAYFGSLYSDVMLGANGLVSLVGEDGIVRARRSGDTLTLNQDVSGIPLFGQYKGQLAGHYVAASPVDGIERLYVFRRLADYPLAVMVAVPMEHVYSRSDERRAGYLMIGVLATVLSIVFGALILRFWRREQAYISELRVSRAQAQSANKMKSEFLASMSHELRTPLNGILGFSDLIRQLSHESATRTYGDTIHTSGHHLLQTLNSILDIAKVEGGKMEINLTRESVRELVGKIVAEHEAPAAAKGLGLMARVGEDVPEAIICDAFLLRQVLDNLLGNAVKFTEQGGVSLRVALDEAGGRVLNFSVSDTGVGISGEAAAFVFEKFSQADQSVTRPHQGAGLGLALARHLVKLMGGAISMHSVPGQGSTFSFTLPIAPSLEDLKSRYEKIDI